MKNIDYNTNLSNNSTATHNDVPQNKILTTTSNYNQNDANCARKSNGSAQNESTINNANFRNINSSHSQEQQQQQPPQPSLFNPTSTTPVKKKSSSFLHRDYNRKPILARSQVSMMMRDGIWSRGRVKKYFLIQFIFSYLTPESFSSCGACFSRMA